MLSYKEMSVLSMTPEWKEEEFLARLRNHERSKGLRVCVCSCGSFVNGRSLFLCFCLTGRVPLERKKKLARIAYLFGVNLGFFPHKNICLLHSLVSTQAWLFCKQENEGKKKQNKRYLIRCLLMFTFSLNLTFFLQCWLFIRRGGYS